jgi:hypothetical protein
MECVWLFTLWSLMPLVLPATRDTVFYISGGILQLVFLPLILVGQSLLSRASEDRAAQDHRALMKLLRENQHILKEQRIEDADLTDIVKRLDVIENQIGGLAR